MAPALRLEPYRLPLRRPWRSARGELRERAGWLVIAERDGIRGYGDCAPLPAAGTEPPDRAAERLRHWCQRAAAGDDPRSLLGDLAAESGTPCADAAVETALLDLEARRRGLTLRRLLAGVEVARDAVAVNAMLGAAGRIDPDRVTTLVARGFRVLKLKVGDAPWQQELACVQALAARLPDGHALRLDANGAWGPAGARAFIAGLDGLPIDALEEPLRDPDDAGLVALQQRAGFSLALDESLPGRPRPIDPARLPVRRLVLKPGAIGGPRRTLALARLARAAGREVVLTSLVESAAGLWATAQLAAASGSPLAHGLATGDWLARDLGPAPLPARGRIRLPAAAGSGFEPRQGWGA